MVLRDAEFSKLIAHPRLLSLALSCGESVPATAGYVLFLWDWASSNCVPASCLPGCYEMPGINCEIHDALVMQGFPSMVLDGLKEAGFLDDDPPTIWTIEALDALRD